MVMEEGGPDKSRNTLEMPCPCTGSWEHMVFPETIHGNTGQDRQREGTQSSHLIFLVTLVQTKTREGGKLRGGENIP